MNARIRATMDKRARGEKGFTLIELLVVIIIIGILAAIAIPAFLNQRQKAWVSQVQSDLKNASIAAESFAVDNNGSYVNATTPLDATVETGGTAGTVWHANGFNSTAGVTITFAATGTPTGSSYKLVGSNANIATSQWTYDSTTGVITKTA